MTYPKAFLEATTAACFEHLVQQLDNKQRTDLASVLKVSYGSTFCVWVRNGLKAHGENLLRLRVVLRLFGYQPSEWKELPVYLQYVAEGMAYGVVTLDDARSGLGYKKPQDVYRQLLHSNSMYPFREKLAKEFATGIEADVTKERFKLHSRIMVAYPELARVLPPMSKPAEVDVLSMEQVQIAHGLSIDDLVDMFESQVHALLPLATFFDGDNISDEDRKRLRKQVGYETMGELTNHLRGLSSDKVRDTLAASRTKGRIR